MVPVKWSKQETSSMHYRLEANVNSRYSVNQEFCNYFPSKLWKSLTLWLVRRRSSRGWIRKRSHCFHVCQVRVVWIGKIHYKRWQWNSNWCFQHLCRPAKDSSRSKRHYQILLNKRLVRASCWKTWNYKKRSKNFSTKLLKRWHNSQRDNLKRILLWLLNLNSISMLCEWKLCSSPFLINWDLSCWLC